MQLRHGAYREQHTMHHHAVGTAPCAPPSLRICTNQLDQSVVLIQPHPLAPPPHLLHVAAAQLRHRPVFKQPSGIVCRPTIAEQTL